MLTPRRLVDGLRRRLPAEARWPLLTARVLEVRDLAALKRAMGWEKDPVLEVASLRSPGDATDLNDRRLRDAEVIASACCNGAPGIVLEIGTAEGRTTALMARHAPEARVYTVNLPPEEAAAGGRFITGAPSREEIGAHWRARGCANVEQILANTRHWEPDFGPIDVALIDGCHDADFVHGDTCKVLARCRAGSLILWHDLHPGLLRTYPWMAGVASGIERLYREGRLRGLILHLADSWIGLYRVPEP